MQEHETKPKGLNLKREGKPLVEEEIEPKPRAVSAGAVDKIADYLCNPNDETFREVTFIDRQQGRLLPLVDIIDEGLQYMMESILYRHNSTEYGKIFERNQPIPPNLLHSLVFRTAQWQKSVDGRNFKELKELGLTELEARTMDDERGYSSRDDWDKES